MLLKLGRECVRKQKTPGKTSVRRLFCSLFMFLPSCCDSAHRSKKLCFVPYSHFPIKFYCIKCVLQLGGLYRLLPLRLRSFGNMPHQNRSTMRLSCQDENAQGVHKTTHYWLGTPCGPCSGRPKIISRVESGD